MEVLTEWNVVEIIIGLVSFIGGFAAGCWKLSQYITKNTIITESNNEKLTGIEKTLKGISERYYMDRKDIDKKFNEHEFRIKSTETNITLIRDELDELKIIIKEK